MQSNGYKPAPLDLNYVKLTPNQNTLVERLAENGHNVWARDRVRQGWTYSIVQVLKVYTLSLFIRNKIKTTTINYKNKGEQKCFPEHCLSFTSLIL